MSAPEDQAREMAQAIAHTEESLLALKERYTQVIAAEQKRSQFQQQRRYLKQQRNVSRSQVRVELEEIQRELENLELILESRLFNWKSMREPFWQALRFGGLGIILGWLLKSWAAS